MKAAINTYFMHSKSKLLPACATPTNPEEEDDEFPFDTPGYFSNISWGSSFRNKLRELGHQPVPEEVAFVTHDEEEDASVVTFGDDGIDCHP